MIFRDRTNAGMLLAKKISKIYFNKNNTIVIAHPKGGVPIGYEIAKELQVPLDVLLIENIEAPSFPELEVGTISEDGVILYDNEMIERLGYEMSDLQPFVDIAKLELQKTKSILRREYPSLPLAGKDIILVDDGVLTGSTMETMIKLLKLKDVGKIIIVTPVSSQTAMAKLIKQVDMFEVIMVPMLLSSVSEWYKDFALLDIEEIKNILGEFSRITKASNSQEVKIQELNISLNGKIYITEKIKSWIVFMHGSGSSYQSFKNSSIAEALAKTGHGSLIFDALAEAEDPFSNRFNVSMLAKRLALATRWLMKSKYYSEGIPIAYYGANTGAAATIMATAEVTDPNLIYAIVSNGGRLDLVDKKALSSVYIPTLLLVNNEDLEMVENNKIAAETLPNCRLSFITPSAGDSSGEIKLITEWFSSHVPGTFYQPSPNL